RGRSDRPRADPQPARRAGDGHGALARIRALHEGAGRGRNGGARRGQGADGPDEAHRRGHDRPRRRHAEGHRRLRGRALMISAPGIWIAYAITAAVLWGLSYTLTEQLLKKISVASVILSCSLGGAIFALAL